MARINFNLGKTLEKELKKPMKECSVLDVGCWEGRMSMPIAGKVKSLHGVDIRRCSGFKGKNVTFTRSSIFPYLKKCRRKFDIIICSEVIEHIDDQESFLREIRRCLADDGIVFLTTNNKYWWREGHYRLPFLTYLPKSFQKRYIKLFNKERTCGYEVTELFSYSRLKHLFIETGYIPRFVLPEGLRFPYSLLIPIMKGPLWNFSVGFMVIAGKKYLKKEVNK